MGKAHGSSYALSQVGSRWVVGTHAVLGADSVVSLHAFHLKGERNATATCESQAPVSWGHPDIPFPPPLHGFKGSHSGCMGSKILICWPWVFDLVASQSAHTDQLQVVWYEMSPSSSSSSRPMAVSSYYRWRCICTQASTFTASSLLPSPQIMAQTSVYTWPLSEGKCPSSSYSSPKTNPPHTGGHCSARDLLGG